MPEETARLVDPGLLREPASRLLAQLMEGFLHALEGCVAVGVTPVAQPADECRVVLLGAVVRPGGAGSGVAIRLDDELATGLAAVAPEYLDHLIIQYNLVLAVIGLWRKVVGRLDRDHSLYRSRSGPTKAYRSPCV